MHDFARMACKSGILLFAMVGCAPAAPVASAKKQDKPEALQPTADWPVFRGDTAGTGIATSKLPEQLDLLWTFEPKHDTFFEATSVIADGVVYVGDVDKKFYAIDLKTGKEIWAFDVEIGFMAAAAVRDGRVFAGDSDGVFYCWNTKDGKLLWKHETGAEINSSPNFYKDSVLVGSQDGSLYRFKADDGKIIWQYTIKASGGIQCSPTLGGDRCFVCGCDGMLHIIDVEKGNSVATLVIGDPTLSTAAIYGDFVYFGNEGATFYGVDWRKPKVVWTYQHAQRQLAFRSSAAVTDETVIVGGRDKIVHALDRANGNELWTFPTRGKVDSSPVLVGSRIFVGSDDGRLYALDVKTGKEMWSYDAGAGFTASPAVGEGRLVIGNDAGVLYCFGEK
jgi:outer membrane protein assembly factor BamB